MITSFVRQGDGGVNIVVRGPINDAVRVNLEADPVEDYPRTVAFSESVARRSELGRKMSTANHMFAHLLAGTCLAHLGRGKARNARITEPH